MLPGAVHGGGAELVDIDGLRIDYSLYVWAALCEKAVFFIK